MKLSAPFHFVGAMVRAAWWKIRGYEVLVSVGEQITRLEICANCPFFDSDRGECGVCGCDIDAKTILASETCPKRKWRRIKQKKRTL